MSLERGIAKLSDLKAAPYNPRKISPAALKGLRASIERFGVVQDIVVNRRSGYVVGGHQRLEALRLEKRTEVPVCWVDLDDAEERALNVALNNPHISGEFDDSLQELLQSIKDGIGLPAMQDLNLDDLLAPVAEEGQTDPDDVPEAPEDPITKLGDVWLMGDHRLMCGDSSDVLAVDRLKAGAVVDLVFTDPPYNIGYQDMGAKFDKIANDKMSDEDFVDFLRSTIPSAPIMYVCCSWQYSHLFKQAMSELGHAPKSMIVWDKVNPAQNLDLYFKQHEIIFYHGPFGGQKTVRGDVWQMKRQRNTVHPTMKPVELVEMALADHQSASVVLDVFGGSGSTLIAAERTGRKALLMELDPKYCDVIVKRWEDFTGKKAVLDDQP